MQTEPEQWARDLLEAVHDASDMGSACGMVDCPQCKAAALTIQRAFEERERKLREALWTPGEEAFKAIHGWQQREKRPGVCEWNPLWLRFRRFLDAEAWTDAAMMLVPEGCRIVTLTEHLDRGGWYAKLTVHEPHKSLPCETGPTLALALAQACLKARENGDGAN